MQPASEAYGDPRLTDDPADDPGTWHANGRSRISPDAKADVALIPQGLAEHLRAWLRGD